MRILYLDQTGKLGGGEIALLPWLTVRREGARVLLFEDGPFRARLDALGIAVEVLTSEALKGVRRESGLSALLVVLPTLNRLRMCITAQAADFEAIYANSQKAFILGCLTRRKGQPLIWHLRDILTADHFSQVMRRVAVFLGNRCATLILVNSQATADAYEAAGGDGSKVRVVHDGVPAESFDAVSDATILRLRSEIEGLRTPPQEGGRRVLVGLFGRLSPWKGQLVLLDAIAPLTEVEAVLVGDALFGEDAYVEQLRERARQPDIAGRVHFLGFRQDVPALMRSMDIIAHTSTAPEPFGLVVVEGMLARKPVIATAAGGTLEIVEDGQSGLLVPPGSSDALTGALRRLLGDRELHQRLVDGGRRRAESDFSAAAMVEATDRALAALGLRCD